MGVQDPISLKGFKIQQCKTQIQQDGHNCGVITLKVCSSSEIH